jgi:hypothetical protein
MVYTINRDFVLGKHVLRDVDVPGCEVVSGPFVRGAGLNDPAGYAYNDQVEPRPYDPRLAMTLSHLALHDVAEEAKARNEELTKIPPLVIAHPADDVARTACKEIKKQLQVISITVELREIDPAAPPTLEAGDDFLYAALTLDEPLLDARRLLGSEGPMGICTAYMQSALDDVDRATGWKEAAAALEVVHRVAYDDTAIVPLWQLTEHLAYHRSLEGVGAKPATLYQNVERWKASVRLPETAP